MGHWGQCLRPAGLLVLPLLLLLLLQLLLLHLLLQLLLQLLLLGLLSLWLLSHLLGLLQDRYLRKSQVGPGCLVQLLLEFAHGKPLAFLRHMQIRK